MSFLAAFEKKVTSFPKWCLLNPDLDEDVLCEKCEGNCLVGDDDEICDVCGGMGVKNFAHNIYRRFFWRDYERLLKWLEVNP